MNILSINNFNLYNKPTATIQNRDVVANRFGMKLAKPLSKDTVSFGCKTRIADFAKESVKKDELRLRRLATTYLDILESVAIKLKDFGVSFDRAYCEKNPVKSADSYVSKLVRAGSVPDQIRATLYVKNPYDLSILNDHILPELEKRDFIIAKTQMKIEDLMKRGYIPDSTKKGKKTISVPDLDIRLEGVLDQASLLSPELRYSIGSPQKSGYEDIQIRLVRAFDPKRNPVSHELLIIFGENYALAKKLEYEKIYKNIRSFNELNIMLKDNNDASNLQMAKRYVDLIRRVVTNEISEKLFENAKNKDLYGITEDIPINISAKDINIIQNYFNGLSYSIRSYYKEAILNVEDVPTKKLYANERRADIARINKIREELIEAIDYFNKSKHLNEQL